MLTSEQGLKGIAHGPLLLTHAHHVNKSGLVYLGMRSIRRESPSQKSAPTVRHMNTQLQLPVAAWVLQGKASRTAQLHQAQINMIK